MKYSERRFEFSFKYVFMNNYNDLKIIIFKVLILTNCQYYFVIQY